jgi:hypothetical protein
VGLNPEDNRHSTVTRKISLYSVEPVTISYTHVHWFLPEKYFTCKNCLNWDISHYFYFFTKYIALLSLIVEKSSLHISYIYNHCRFVRFCMTFLIYIHVRNGTKNEFWDCATSSLKNALKISTFLNYRTSQINWRIYFFWGEG